MLPTIPTKKQEIRGKIIVYYKFPFLYLSEAKFETLAQMNMKPNLAKPIKNGEKIQDFHSI